MKPLLLWKSNNYCIFLRVCARECVGACVGTWERSCVRVCMGMGAWALACACARIALLNQHATRRRIAICGLSGTTTFFDVIS